MSLAEQLQRASLAEFEDRRGAEAFDGFAGRWAPPATAAPAPDPLLLAPVDHGYVFSKRSWRSLRGVDCRLVAVATEALTRSPIDFVVIEGVRSEKRQRGLLASGASRTMNSRHLTGHAIDVAAYTSGGISWDRELYAALAVHFKASAERLGIPLQWGGDFRGFFDGPHFQIPWRAD